MKIKFLKDVVSGYGTFKAGEERSLPRRMVEYLPEGSYKILGETPRKMKPVGEILIVGKN